jgi:hypothetical protein
MGKKPLERSCLQQFRELTGATVMNVPSHPARKTSAHIFEREALDHYVEPEWCAQGMPSSKIGALHSIQPIVYGFLTTAPNAIVEPIHPKAMPVILTTDEEARRLDARAVG